MQFASTFAVVIAMGLMLPTGGAAGTAVPSTGRSLSPAADTILTTDPLTGLPLDPETVCRTALCIQFHTGNEPQKLPDARWCKSTMQVDFYSLLHTRVKVDATVAWYVAHLPGFKRTHAYAGGRSDDTFYNAAGTLFVLVMGTPGKDGENTDTYSISYYRVQPGLPEKSIVAINRQQSVC